MILIVEDELYIRRFLCINLEARGYQVVETGCGTAALEAIQHQPPALMLLDIKLPGIDGWEVLRRLDQVGAPDFPVVMVTASSPPTSEQEHEFPRIVHTLMKPIDAVRLVQVVEEALHHS